MTETVRQRVSPRGDHRILYVSDPSTVARTFLPDPVREQDLRRWVDMVADSGVDLFDQEVFSQGWTAYWQSDHYQYDQRHQHRRFLPLLEAGIQPLEVVIDQAHRRDMAFVAGFRINDGHAYQAREQGWFDFRPEPPRVFSTRWFSLPPDTVVYGENCLSVTLARSDPGARQPVIVIDELEIFVEP